MRALVKETREVAQGTLLVVFDLQGEELDFRPGQYFWVELPNRGHEDEKGLRRHISVCTSPTERGVLGLCTRLRDTAFKQTLAELKVGDEADVEQPKGDWVLPEDTSRTTCSSRAESGSRSSTACCATSPTPASPTA